MNREEKDKIVKDLEDKFARCASCLFAEFKELNVSRMEGLRRKSRDAKIEIHVVKNTLASRAIQILNIKGTDQFLVGPTALAFGWDDPITPIKVLNEFTKDNPELHLKGGIVDGTVVQGAKLDSLAKLPSKDVLISQLLMSMQSSARGLVTVLSGPMRGFLNCLKSLEDQKKG